MTRTLGPRARGVMADWLETKLATGACTRPATEATTCFLLALTPVFMLLAKAVAIFQAFLRSYYRVKGDDKLLGPAGNKVLQVQATHCQYMHGWCNWTDHQTIDFHVCCPLVDQAMDRKAPCMLICKACVS